VRERIARAAARAGRRPADITLVGVSKRQPAEAVAALVAAGLAHCGENFVQEAREKIPRVAALLGPGVRTPRWHFIGRLQRNKAGAVARHFDVVQTVDRARLGQALQDRAGERPESLAITLQVDLSEEPQKGGVAPESLPDLLAECRAWTHLRTIGLMAIPAATEGPEASRAAFARLRALRDGLREAPGGVGLRELSMVMSADFEVAIEEGATIVRVGTALYGAR